MSGKSGQSWLTRNQVAVILDLYRAEINGGVRYTDEIAERAGLCLDSVWRMMRRRREFFRIVTQEGRNQSRAWGLTERGMLLGEALEGLEL